MLITKTIEKVVQQLGGSVNFRKTPDGKDLYVSYRGEDEHEDCVFDLEYEAPPYTIFIFVSADNVQHLYQIPIKTFVQGMGKIRGNEEAFEVFLHHVFASIF